MKLVIELDEKVYNSYMNYTENYVDFKYFGAEEKIVRAIRNGTPFPEKHGRLIDADALQMEMEKDVRKAMSFVDLKDFVWLAPTIIEGSDKEWK